MLLCSLLASKWVDPVKHLFFLLVSVPCAYYLFIFVLSSDDLHKNYDNFIEVLLLSVGSIVYLAVQNKYFHEMKFKQLSDIAVSLLMGSLTASIPALSLFGIYC